MRETSRENNYKYIEINMLGKGSYGKAYLVECTSDRSLAVIKTIPLDTLTEDAKKEAYLESKILEKLDHSNIIRFREVFLTKLPSLTLHIVMDYAEGGDLQKRIYSQKEFLPENQILDWFTQICLAIKYIHDRKILHRDIKSQNIFLTRNNLIKLGDFGTAKCLNYTLEPVQTTKGTPYYLSPEIVMNKPYSFKSDIWSLGVLLYEMTALKMPFNSQTLPLLCLEITKGVYKPIPKLYSAELKVLIGSMLQLNPNNRPSIYEVLGCNIIQSRIKGFLSEFEYNQEFSNTILHKINYLNSPDNKNKKKSSDSQNNRSSNVSINSTDQKDYSISPNRKNMNSDEKNNNIVGNNSSKENVSVKVELKETNSIENQFDITNIEKENKSDEHHINTEVQEMYLESSEPKRVSQITKLQGQTNSTKKESLSIESNIKPESRQSDKGGSHTDILNVLAKHKKNIQANKESKTPRLNQLSSTELKSPQNNNPGLKSFIETMHNKINLSEEGVENEPLKIENNKNEIADLLSTHKMLVELSTIDNLNSKKEQEKNDNISEVCLPSNLNNINFEKLDLTNEFKSSHFTPDVINTEVIDVNANIDSQNNQHDLEAELTELELMNKKLLEELGPQTLMIMHSIVSKYTPEKELKIDIDLISYLVKNELKNSLNESDLMAAIAKIYEVWLLVVKERQDKFGQAVN